jgi:UDP-N-acetylmuramate-alanine ligase
LNTSSLHYHISGVAGVGMSALAQAMIDQGFQVSGSDRFHDQGKSIPVLDQLVRYGVELLPQDGTGIRTDTAGLVVSTAIEEDNPEIQRARALNTPIVHRAKMLAQFANRAEHCIAIAGTAGKTTTTGMVGWVLEQAGADPSVVNGGAVVDWAGDEQVGNTRKGGNRYWVVEVDESDKSLLNFSPHSAVITNISRDHFGLDETVELFREFAQSVSGPIFCGAGVRALLEGAHTDLREPAFEPRQNDGVWAFSLGEHEIALPRMPGRHNAENAFHAALLCRELGVDEATIAEALHRFSGIERRLQVVGNGDPLVIDDYAHNPAKIQAAWNTMAERSERILACWKPHGFGPLAAMQDELAEMFRETMRPDDRLWILPVFYAGGTAGSDFDGETFAKQLISLGIAAAYARDYDALQKIWTDESRAGDTLLCMGARDPDLPVFARTLGRLSVTQ